MARVCIANVSDDGDRIGSFLSTQIRCLLGCCLVDIDASDVGTFSGAQHGDSTSIADGGIGIVGRPRARSDNDDATLGQPIPARRGAE